MMYEKNLRIFAQIVWSDEIKFKMNGPVNGHNCCYYYSSNHLKQIEILHDVRGVIPHDVWYEPTSS